MTDWGRAPDRRNIYDVTTIEECDDCGWAPAVVIITDDEDGDGKHWECYNCGAPA